MSESLTPEREGEIREWVEAVGKQKDIRYYGSWQQHGELLGEIDRLRNELAKYVGEEPTIAEEMAYLSRCLHAVHDLCDQAEKQAGRWKQQPLPAPAWVEQVRKAADGVKPRTSYPPAFPWAALMDEEDLRDFLADLAAAAITYYHHRPDEQNNETLAAVEKACATWRVIAEAQHAHNTAPGADAESGGNHG